MILGITGGVGAGKSSVLAILEKEYNAKLILADEVGRELMQPGEANYVNIVNAFGKEILNPDGTIDRKILGRIVFDQPEKLKKLNTIVHPAVNEKIREEMQKAQEEGKELFVLEAALLTEPVYREMLDEIWYIHVPQEIRMERLRSSRGYSDEKMYAVFANQPSEETFTAVSDLVIENGGTFEETEKQIDLALGRG